MSGKRKIHITKSKLEKLYQKFSMKEIAKIYECGETLIHNRIHEFGIVLKGVGKGGHRKKKGKVFTKEHRKNLSKAQKQKKGEQNQNWKGGNLKLICLNCEAIFEVIRARKYSAKFCSNNCRSLWRSNNWIGGNHPNYNKEAPRKKKCLSGICTNIFEQRPTEAISTFIERKFCSKKCSDRDGFRYKGKDHPKYKKDSRRRSDRGQQASWQRKIFSRDKGTCQHCGITNVPLIAHHIKEFEKYKELRWDVDNGITLCEQCHWRAHGYNLINDKDIAIFEKKGRTFRRWEGNCSWCGAFISKQASDLKKYDGTNEKKKHLFCDKKCSGSFRSKTFMERRLQKID